MQTQGINGPIFTLIALDSHNYPTMGDVAIQTGGSNTPATGDTGVLVWIIALPVTILAAAFVLKRKEREA